NARMDPRSESETAHQLRRAEPPSTDRGLLTLPLVSPNPSPAVAPAWHGWTPALPLPDPASHNIALDSPEPLEPQGAYSADASEALLQVPLLAEAGARPVELLAPAGG